MFCFIVRKKISDTHGQGRRLPRRIKKHVKNCTGCQQFLQQNQQLSATLGLTDHPGADLPPFLHRRVMHALKSEQPAPSWKWLFARTAVVACTFVVIGLGLFLPNALLDNQGQALAESKSDWGSLQLLEAGVMQAEKIISGSPDVLVQPLSTEIQYLEEDLMAVAEKLDSILNGSVFSIISQGNG